MPTLYLLCGMPFSGKTTLGKSIAQYLNVPYISLDEINEARGLKGGEGITVEEWEKTHFLARKQLEILIQSERDLIIDDTSCFRWLRDRFRNLAFKYDYQTTIVFLDLPLTEIWRRMENNQKKQMRHLVRPNIVREMAKTFEPPQEDENVIKYSANESIEQWISKHLKFRESS